MIYSIINKLNRKTIFLISFIVFSVYAVLIPYNINESTDFIAYYYPAGQNIAKGLPPEGISSDLGYKYPPGFPLLIALVINLSNFTDLDFSMLMFIFSALCVYLASLLLSQITKEFYSYESSLLISLIFISYPLTLWTLKQPGSESSFLVFFFLAILSYIRALRKNKDNHFLYLLSGLSLGFSMLIRPIAIGLPFVFIGFIFYVKFKDRSFLKKSFLASLLILSGVAITVLPWEYHVYKKENKIILLSDNGAASIYDGLTFNIRKDYREKNIVSKDMDDLMYSFSSNLSIKSSLKEVLYKVKQEFIIRPLTVIKLFIYKFLKTFYGTDTQKHEEIIIIFQLIYYYFIVKAMSISLKNLRMEKFEYFFIVIILYFSCMATISLSIVRYTFPATCLLFACLPAYLEKKNFKDEN